MSRDDDIKAAEHALNQLPPSLRPQPATPDSHQILDAILELRAQQHPLAEWVINWPDFWAADDTDTEWLLEPILAAGRAHALYAGAKTGKSYLALPICVAVATGTPFLHQPAGTPVDVLYIDYEMTAEDLRDRLTGFGYGPDTDLTHLHYALLPSLPPLNTAEGGQALLDSAIAVGAALVVIDTTGRAVAGEENDNDVIRDYYRHTGIRLKAEGITVLRLDHAGHANTHQRGASAKNDDVDVVWKLTRRDDGQLLEATHRRMSWVPERVELGVVEGDDGVTRFTIAESTWPAGTAAVAAELDRLGVPLEWGKKRIRTTHGDALKCRNGVLLAAIKHRRQAGTECNEMIGKGGPRHNGDHPGPPNQGPPTGTPGTTPNQPTENPIKPAVIGGPQKSGTTGDHPPEQVVPILGVTVGDPPEGDLFHHFAGHDDPDPDPEPNQPPQPPLWEQAL